MPSSMYSPVRGANRLRLSAKDEEAFGFEDKVGFDTHAAGETDVRAVFGIRERRFKVGFEWSGAVAWQAG